MHAFSNHWLLIGSGLLLIISVLFYKSILRLAGIVIVPDDSIGVVTKKFVLFGRHRTLPAGRILALNGEAGFQADTLAPGLHMGLWPWQYTVDRVEFLTIPPGKVGVVEACDGVPLPSGRIVARQADSDSSRMRARGQEPQRTPRCSQASARTPSNVRRRIWLNSYTELSRGGSYIATCRTFSSQHQDPV